VWDGLASISHVLEILLETFFNLKLFCSGSSMMTLATEMVINTKKHITSSVMFLRIIPIVFHILRNSIRNSSWLGRMLGRLFWRVIQEY
jgi:hypothetical protein